MSQAISSYSVEERILDGGMAWVAIRARGAEWSWLTPAEAAHFGRQWAERYGSRQLGLPVNPVRIDDVLGKSRSDADWQDPWKHPAECTRKYAADDEKKIGSVIEGPAQRAHRSPAACYRPIQKIRYQRYDPRDQSENRRMLISFRHEERKRHHQKQTKSGQRISHQ